MLHVPIKASGVAAEFTPWRLIVREHLNPSAGERIFRIGLAPLDAALDWRAGDIAEFELPDGQMRSYSIASVPSEGRLDLLIRETRTPEGTLGRGTAWLLYGDKSCESHSHLCREMQAWHLNGVLYRFNLALSHPKPGQGRYVQDVISQYATDIRHFMGAGGQVMVCGGLALGAAVETALGEALGEAWMGEAFTDTRYRQALF